MGTCAMHCVTWSGQRHAQYRLRPSPARFRFNENAFLKNALTKSRHAVMTHDKHRDL